MGFKFSFFNHFREDLDLVNQRNKNMLLMKMMREAEKPESSILVYTNLGSAFNQ